MPAYNLLIINPGSASTKIAIFENEKPQLIETLNHSAEELAPFGKIYDQLNFRKDAILRILGEKGLDLRLLDAVVGSGGLLRPVEAGTYNVNAAMLKDLEVGPQGQHASNLGGLIAGEIASKLNIQAFVVDPAAVDEMDDIARISGMKEIDRKCKFHALNQKAVAKKYSRERGLQYEDLNLIVAHIGEEISIGVHKGGRVIDVNNCLDGEGPFSPERAGSLPVGDLVKLCYSGKYTYEEIMRKITGHAGFTAYFNTNDARVVRKMVEEGDKKAELVFMAMAYQVAKEIGACATVLCGEVDAIVLTGGLAHDSSFVDWIREMIGFIAEIVVYPGEDEMLALAEGGLRVLRGEERAKVYC